MAYVSKEIKQAIVSRLKENFPKWSFRLKVVHDMTIKVTLVSADVDFLNIAENFRKEKIENYNGFNDLFYRKEPLQSGFEVYGDMSRYFGKNNEAINKIESLMSHINLVGDIKNHNYNRSDVQSDYFDVGYYVTLKIGGDTPSTEFKYIPEVKKNKIKM